MNLTGRPLDLFPIVHQSINIGLLKDGKRTLEQTPQKKVQNTKYMTLYDKIKSALKLNKHK